MLSNKRQNIVEATLNFGSIAANTSDVLTATVLGAVVGDPVLIVPPFESVMIQSQGTLTMDTNPTDGDTMTVDTKVYTFVDTLTGADGEIKIGTLVADTQASTVAAFDLSGTVGTDYGALMTAHPTVDIAAFATNDAVLTAKAYGTAGDSIATTETFTAGTNVFDATTLGTTTAGSDSIGLIFSGLVTADETVTVQAFNVTAGALDAASGDFQIIVWV